MSQKNDGVELPLTNRSGPDDDANNDYDPHLHRQIEKPTNNMETFVHLLKCSLGTGILAMPQAFNRAGLLVGVVGTVLIGILCTYCLHVLVRSQYILCKRKKVPLLTYPESMRVALDSGPKSLRFMSGASPAMVDIFIVVYQLGIGCVYIVFIAAQVKSILDPYVDLSVSTYMLISLIPLLMLNCIRNLKFLAPFSAFANVITLISLAAVVYYLVTMPPVDEEVVLVGELSTMPLFFGTTLFALMAVGVVIALENNMKTPKAFGRPMGVLNTGMAFIVALYVVVGALGYMQCRSQCKDSVTLGLPERDPVATAVMALLALAIFISYGLQCYVPVDIVWRTYVQPRLAARGVQKMLLWEYVMRISMGLMTFVLAIAIPRLGLFISLFGAFCLSALGIMFPALIEVCVLYPNKFGPGKWKLVKDLLLIVIGGFGLVVGTYSAVEAIIVSFQD